MPLDQNQIKQFQDIKEETESFRRHIKNKYGEEFELAFMLLNKKSGMGSLDSSISPINLKTLLLRILDRCESEEDTRETVH